MFSATPEVISAIQADRLRRAENARLNIRRVFGRQESALGRSDLPPDPSREACRLQPASLNGGCSLLFGSRRAAR